MQVQRIHLRAILNTLLNVGMYPEDFIIRVSPDVAKQLKEDFPDGDGPDKRDTLCLWKIIPDDSLLGGQFSIPVSGGFFLINKTLQTSSTTV